MDDLRIEIANKCLLFEWSLIAWSKTLFSRRLRLREKISGAGRAIALLLMVPVLSMALYAQSAPTFDVISRGAKCDGTTADESQAFSAAITAASHNCDGSTQTFIDLPMGKTCKFAHPLVLNAACVGIRGNGATLDFSSLKSGAAITVTWAGTTALAINQPGTWENFHLRGPGLKSNTIGMLIQAPENMFRKIDIYNFGVGIQAGNNFYINVFDFVKIWQTGTAFLCPSGVKNSGENIVFNQGVIASTITAFNDVGVCDIHVNEMSFDGLSGSVYSSIGGSGSFECISCHIEYFTPITVPIFDIAGCNAWTSVDIEGGSIITDTATKPNMFALIRNDPRKACGGSGSWAYFSRVFFAGLSPSTKCDAGSGATCVTGSNTSQVHIDRSTIGDGGGTWGNAHLP